MTRPVVLLVAVAAVLCCVDATLMMPKVFADNMVLQTNHEYGARSFLFGFGIPGETVIITGGAGSYNVTVLSSGKWAAQLNPHGASTKKLTINVSGTQSTNTLSFSGVMFGDVYLCSGQSNMVFPLDIATNGSAEAQTVTDWPALRIMMVNLTTSPVVLKDLPVSLSWTQPTVDQIKAFSAVCYLTVRDLYQLRNADKKNSAIGLIQSAWGGTRIEAFMSPEALAECVADPIPSTSHNAASVLWNSMIAPMAGYSMRAVYWYQGEANADQWIKHHHDQYDCMLASMITSWRNAWGLGDFPFLYMQLPPSLTADKPKFSVTGRQYIRQAMANDLPNHNLDTTGMAVTIDLGGVSAWGSDHPPNKPAMAHRLALASQHVLYAFQTPYVNWTGPIPTAASVGSDGLVTISFQADSTASGLKLAPVVNCTSCCSWTGDPDTSGTPFEASADGGKTWASVNVSSVVASPPSIKIGGVAGVDMIRYAWTDFVQCVLYNDNDLPTGPFMMNVTKATTTTTTTTTTEVPIKASSSLPVAPPMGLNTWNSLHVNVDSVLVREFGQAFHDLGLAKVGYEYVNIDDGWQAQERYPNGTIMVDPVRFPEGFKWLADQLHAMDLKFGIYTAAHGNTCQGRPGSYGHEAIDSATYCDYGIDYLKIDQCGGARYPQANTSWIRFQEGFETCFKATGRAIFESVESCGTLDGCGEWIADVANAWRMHGDVQANWASIMSVIDTANPLWPLHKPSHAPDLDMLEVGNVGLSDIEGRSHFALWCIMVSPLLIGNDIRLASNETLATLTAEEVIALNQDPMVNQARRVAISGTATGSGYTYKQSFNSTDNLKPGVREVWAKQMSDGSAGALLLNRDDTAAVDITVSFDNLPNMSSSTKATVRDLFARKDLGVFTGSFTASGIAPHDQLTIRVTPVA